MAGGGARGISRPCVHLQLDLIISSRTSMATTRTEKASLHFGGQVYQIPVLLWGASAHQGRGFPIFFCRILHHELSLGAFIWHIKPQLTHPWQPRLTLSDSETPESKASLLTRGRFFFPFS